MHRSVEPLLQEAYSALDAAERDLMDLPPRIEQSSFRDPLPPERLPVLIGHATRMLFAIALGALVVLCARLVGWHGASLHGPEWAVPLAVAIVCRVLLHVIEGSPAVRRIRKRPGAARRRWQLYWEQHERVRQRRLGIAFGRLEEIEYVRASLRAVEQGASSPESLRPALDEWYARAAALASHAKASRERHWAGHPKDFAVLRSEYGFVEQADADAAALWPRRDYR